MTNSIHDVLDGRASLDDLSPEDRQVALSLARTLNDAARLLTDCPVPDLADAVMNRIGTPNRRSALGRGIDAVRNGLQWWWRPRPFSIALRPAYAVALAGILLVIGTLAESPRATPAPFVAAEDGIPSVYVQFRLERAEATRVALAGSFSNWEPAFEMEETTPGVWSILLPLRPGVHDYAFLVDGDQWVADPHAFLIDDGFGGLNSRIALPQPTAQGTLRS